LPGQGQALAGVAPHGDDDDLLRRFDLAPQAEQRRQPHLLLEVLADGRDAEKPRS